MYSTSTAASKALASPRHGTTLRVQSTYRAGFVPTYHQAIYLLFQWVTQLEALGNHLTG